MNSTPIPSAAGRILGSCLFLAVIGPGVRAQTAGADAPVSAPASPKSDIVQMSQFEVMTTQGHGYLSTNAAEAFKTNESLMDIPQIDVVVTQDLIKDLNYTYESDMLEYLGLYHGFEGETVKIRGASTPNAFVDGMPDDEFTGDSILLDSIEVVKGPAESLYVESGVSGVVLKSLKKPLPFFQAIVSASIDSFGLRRFTGDFTGPLATVGDTKLFYRMVMAYQKGGDYFYNARDQHTIFFPEFEAHYHFTTVRGSFSSQVFDQNFGPDVQALVTPDGQLFTGAGRKEANFPPHDGLDNHVYTPRIDMLQKLSDNWEMKISAMYWRQNRIGSVLSTDGYNWATQEEYFTSSETRSYWTYWTVLDDAEGHFTLGPSTWEMKNTSAFGFAWSDWISRSGGWSTTLYPFSDTARGIPNLPGQPAGTFAVPMNNAAALQALTVPPASTYYDPGTGGSHLETLNSSVYWQHSIFVVPDWLQIVAGMTWENIQTISVSNIHQHPYVAQQIPFKKWVHRIGAIFHPTREISIYALDSQAFSPATAGTDIYGQLPPPQGGDGRELGMKIALFNGRLSGDFAWFQMHTTNVYSIVTGSVSPFTGAVGYEIPIGDTIQEGVDGDLAFTVVPGWQVIGGFYAGHDRDANHNPVSNSFDNSWGLFNRYDFPKGPLHGLTIGGGITRIGGRWVSSGGVTGAVFEPITVSTGEIKLWTGTKINGFMFYAFNRHWMARLTCQNILNVAYVTGDSNAYAANASVPRNFVIEADYKF